MIKVVVGFRIKVGTDIQPTLLKLRSYAMTFPGFVSAESLINVQDNTNIVTVSTWENVENWKMWENTKIRKQVLKEAENLLRDQPRITMYTIVPTTGWAYVRSDS